MGSFSKTFSLILFAVELCPLPALEEKIKILESDAETEGEAFKEVCHENENLKDRLATAERYILNQVVYS